MIVIEWNIRYIEGVGNRNNHDHVEFLTDDNNMIRDFLYYKQIPISNLGFHSGIEDRNLWCSEEKAHRYYLVSVSSLDPPFGCLFYFDLFINNNDIIYDCS